MKRVVLLIALVILCAALLAGCGCKHETWVDADCETPKTCAECGETEGEALGHTWVDADCEAAKTCSACQKTEGEALGHTWEDATTETPKTCSVCAKTDGDRIITDARFTTAACKDLFGTWTYTITLDGEMMQLEGFEGTLDVSILFTFHKDGTMGMDFAVDKTEGFDEALKQYMTEALYAELELSGVKRADADAFLQANVGMGMEEYVNLMVQMVDFEAAFAAYKMEGKYYVDGDQLYVGETWEEMEGEKFVLQGDTLELETMAEGLGVEEAYFVRVENTDE